MFCSNPKPDKGAKRKKDATKIGKELQTVKRKPTELVEPGLGISEEERKRILQMVEDEPEMNI